MQEMPNFAEMPESVRSIMKASIDQARKAFETFISASQQVMSNFEGPPNPATDGMKQLNEKIAEFTRMNADANFRFAMKLTDAKQLNDVVDIQNHHMRELMESYGKQLEELRSLTTNAAYSASSSGRPRRPAEVQKSCICKSRSGNAWARSVSKMPAAIAFTRTPNVAASRERHLVKPIIAAFEVA